MKKLFLLAFSIIMTVYTYGAEKSATPNGEINAEKFDGLEKAEVMVADILQQDKDTIVVPIKVADLPQAVKETLAKYEYNGWEVKENAYHIKTKDGKTKFFKVTLYSPASGANESIKLDENGKSVN